MINTRSQNVDSYAACSSGMEQNSDNESEYSFPNTLSRNQINEFENGDLINVRHNSSLNSVDQRFMEMNKQISELTNIVLALTEKISSPTTECSGLNTVINTNVNRSDTHNTQLRFHSRKLPQLDPLIVLDFVTHVINDSPQYPLASLSPSDFFALEYTLFYDHMFSTNSNLMVQNKLVFCCTSIQKIFCTSIPNSAHQFNFGTISNRAGGK